LIINVQTRLLILLAVMICLLPAGMAVLHHSETYRLDLTMGEQEQAKYQLLHKIIDLKSYAPKTLAYDYSFWDDMVKFVNDGDSAWAKKNIDVSLITFHSTIAWVCRTDLTPIYCVSDFPGLDRLTLPISRDSTAAVFQHGYFPHFFVSTSSGVLEIFGAPIQPSSDNSRESPPQGFFFVGRLWSSEYVDELSHLVESHISLSLNSDTLPHWASDRSRGIIRTADTLLDLGGKPLAVVRSESESRFVRELNRAISSRSALILVFLGMLILVLSFTLYRWITGPLRLIATALSNDDPKPIEDLKMTRGDFGQIAHLISQFFRQNANLISEIVEHKRAEQALETASSKVAALAEEQRVLLENARDFIYRHDTQGFFHYVSQSVQVVTGYPPEEWMRHYSTFLTDNPINTLVIDHTEKTLAEGIAFPPYQVEIYHKEGQRIMLEVNEQPFFEDGKIAGIVGVARDVTLRIQAEEQREALQRRLDKAEQMESLGLLAGGVAHDLNNILGPLVAYPELIMMKLPPDSPHRRQLTIMGKAAQDAADVIQDLLALARRGRCELKPISINDIVRQYLESPNSLSLQSLHPAVTVATVLDDNIGNMMGSPSHLMKAIMNLVVNAFEAMPVAGTLTIETSQEHLSHLRSDFSVIAEDDYDVLSIRDTGVGIDPRDIQKIFQPYYSNKQMGASGSGLGLAVVYGIIKDHKGYYDILSELGKGTEFLLYFPVSHQAAVATPPANTDLEGTGTILVVDDVPEQREIAEQILISLGYQVAAAASGREALAHITDRPVDLIVLDMILERDLDGLDTYREILKLNPSQKAIIVSGFAATDRVSQMQAMGAGVYLKKPYIRQQLAEAVKQEMRLPRSANAEGVVGFS
jgi:PAS domain S-box-containing protein